MRNAIHNVIKCYKLLRIRFVLCKTQTWSSPYKGGGLRFGGLAYLGDNALHGLVDVLLFELAFPNGDSSPPQVFKLGDGRLISLHVALKLGDPKVGVALGHGWIAMGAAVPKATVDKDGYLATGKRDVGAAGRLLPL